MLNKFKNFRPNSNLKRLSKITEKSVALQLNNYLTNNNLHETFQSAYKVHHSTETGMFGRGVPPGSPSPDRISDQKTLFSRPVFRPGVLNPYRLSNQV